MIMTNYLSTAILPKSRLETLQYFLSFDDLPEDTRKQIQEEIQQIEKMLNDYWKF